MSRIQRPLLLCVLWTVFTVAPWAHTRAQSGFDSTDNPFDKTIAPILSAHCLTCHSGSEPEGGLDLSRREATMRGGESGVAIVPGVVDESYLWQLVESDDMPPEHVLSEDEKQELRKWIAEGATWGTNPIDPFAFSSDRRAGYDWWSLQPLDVPAVPDVEQKGWSRNEIDRFILAALQDRGLHPSPRADPRTLVRRLYVDLIGLPAPVEVIDRFESDPSQQAWEKLVDKLLASNHYGERWARHWMDVARFGESDGFEYNRPRENSWHYRDWLIRAFNADTPYDEFVRMQLAGDILKPNTLEGAAATGFLVAGTHNTVLGVSPTMKLAGRHDELEELAGTVGQTFLGMTINCARCHDHKFDPITAEEYFGFIAALDGVRHGERTIPSQPESLAQRRQITTKQDALENRLVQRILARRGRASETANLVESSGTVAANTSERTYRVSVTVAPSVWAAAGQATSDRDGVAISLLRQDGTTLAAESFRPGGWKVGENGGIFREESFEYVGDGAGPVRIHLRPFPLNSGRFGGAVDDLAIVDVASGETVFRETFDDLQQRNAAGIQADTGRRVYFGAASERWVHSGTNTLHAVEHAENNLALQLFGGEGGINAITVAAPEETELKARIVSLENRLASIPTPRVYSVISGRPDVMRVFHRGDVTRPGDEIAPSGIAAIKDVSASFLIATAASDAERRLALADWITHRDNGLFHRVAVNRFWHYHFGQGLVTTPNDFGFQGGRASHPNLLDWLSARFRDSGYSIKSLHRLIVTSATYQQSSQTRPDAERVDKSNRFLWRQNPRRIEAEVLRDSILVISGQINRAQFGPGYRDTAVVEVPPAFYYSPRDPVGHEFNRRTVYRWNVRGQRSALLDTFDCPDPSTKTPTRMVTTTPSQALSQWNDLFIVRMSEHLADKIQAESIDDTGEQVTRAWREVLGRSPTDSERASAVRLVGDHGLPILCRVLFNSNEFILID